jgi:flagella basal body P-ring formation protein FlgA
MYCVRKLILAVLMLFSITAIAGEVVHMKLMDNVEVNKREFRLGDIAYIECADMRLRNDLSNIVIGRSPLVGYEGRYDRLSIRSRVEYLFPGLGRDIHWSGADAVTIKALGVRLKQEKYLEGAKKYLEQQLERSLDNVLVEAYGEYKDLNLPEGELIIKYKIMRQNLIRKRMQVWADIYIDGQKTQSQPVWFSVNAYGPAWVASHDLNIGSVISDDLFVRKQIDIAGIYGRVVTKLPECCLMRTKKRITAGDVLVQENVEPVPAIARGSVVKVVATTQNVAIATEAISLQDGRVGDIVRVRKGRGGIMYNAKVIGKDTLTVDGVMK